MKRYATPIAFGLTIVVVIVLASLSFGPAGMQAGSPAEQVRGIRTHAQTPALDVDQRGAGPVAIFRVARTPVAIMQNNGNLKLGFGAAVITDTPTPTNTSTSTATPTLTATATVTPTNT